MSLSSPPPLPPPRHNTEMDPPDDIYESVRDDSPQPVESRLRATKPAKPRLVSQIRAAVSRQFRRFKRNRKSESVDLEPLSPLPPADRTDNNASPVNDPLPELPVRPPVAAPRRRPPPPQDEAEAQVEENTQAPQNQKPTPGAEAQVEENTPPLAPQSAKPTLGAEAQGEQTTPHLQNQRPTPAPRPRKPAVPPKPPPYGTNPQPPKQPPKQPPVIDEFVYEDDLASSPLTAVPALPVYEEVRPEGPGLTCVVCHSRANSVMLLPCYHLCLCEQDAAALVPPMCPLCFTPIQQRIAVQIKA